MPDASVPAPAPAMARTNLFRSAVGLAAIAGGLLGLAGLYFVAIPAANKDPLMLALGVVLGWGGAVVTYEFGSSSTGRRAAEAAIDAVTRP